MSGKASAREDVDTRQYMMDEATLPANLSSNHGDKKSIRGLTVLAPDYLSISSYYKEYLSISSYSSCQSEQQSRG